jgi:hypothetical protein
MGQTLLHSPQAVHLSMSIKRGRWRNVAVKLPASPVTAFTSVMVYRSMFRWRPASTSLGEMIHMEQSLVGKVLSNWDMTPPMAERCFCQDDPVSGIGQIQRCLNAGNAAADDHDGSGS